VYQYVSITLLNKQVAIENGPVGLVDLPMKEGVTFHCCLYVYQRVYLNALMLPNKHQQTSPALSLQILDNLPKNSLLVNVHIPIFIPKD